LTANVVVLAGGTNSPSWIRGVSSRREKKGERGGRGERKIKKRRRKDG